MNNVWKSYTKRKYFGGFAILQWRIFFKILNKVDSLVLDLDHSIYE